jgi:hypothetical protein
MSQHHWHSQTIMGESNKRSSASIELCSSKRGRLSDGANEMKDLQEEGLMNSKAAAKAVHRMTMERDADRRPILTRQTQHPGNYQSKSQSCCEGMTKCCSCTIM